MRHTAVPSPGDDAQVADLPGRIVARPLDRAHPLWESYVIEGLADDRFAILTKVHHATIDGASGAELLTMMLDESPDRNDEPVVPVERTPERRPSDSEFLLRTAANMTRRPARLLVLSARTMRDLGAATRNPVLQAAGSQLRDSLRGPVGALLNAGRSRRTEERDQPPLALPSLRAPRTPFNQSISPHRKFAFRFTSLDAVEQIKTA